MNNKEFGPNIKGNYYIAIYYHQKKSASNNDKSRWCITPNKQYAYFNYSNENNICDESINNTFFYFSKNEPLGCDSEMIGKFIGSKTKWHGFPIRSNEVHFSEVFLDFLEQREIITKVFRRRIVKGQI